MLQLYYTDVHYLCPEYAAAVYAPRMPPQTEAGSIPQGWGVRLLDASTN